MCSLDGLQVVPGESRAAIGELISSDWFAACCIKSRLKRRLTSGELALITVRDAIELGAKKLKRSALLGHVVVPVTVTGLHASETVRLQVSTDLTADALRCEQRLDAGTNPLELEPVDRGADDVLKPATSSAVPMRHTYRLVLG